MSYSLQSHFFVHLLSLKNEIIKPLNLLKIKVTTINALQINSKRFTFNVVFICPKNTLVLLLNISRYHSNTLEISLSKSDYPQMPMLLGFNQP